MELKTKSYIRRCELSTLFFLMYFLIIKYLQLANAMHGAALKLGSLNLGLGCKAVQSYSSEINEVSMQNNSDHKQGQFYPCLGSTAWSKIIFMNILSELANSGGYC